MFGTGSPLIDTQAVQAALQRRQQGGSVPQLSQVSGASPVQASPQPQAPQSGGLPKPQMSQPSMGPQGAQVQAGHPEAVLIIKALGERLKTLSNSGI